ncbi:ABC transporter permease [Rathayibacter sp. KR2-224]|uniref:ABC transporter permease n=1 Tax=Rathayibacter sp. KR2-224 TaxID=3400913 RepID=UPI003BFF5873
MTAAPDPTIVAAGPASPLPSPAGPPPGATPARASEKRRDRPSLLHRFAASPEAGVGVACIVVFAIIAFSAPTYATAGNLQVMGRDLSQLGILAVAEALVILTGGIDLSVGALAGLAGIIAASLNVNMHLPAAVAIVATIVICGLVGAWHGFTVTRLKVPPFVITLVTFTIAQGLSLAITSGTPINGIDPMFSDISGYYVFGVPVPALFFIAVVLIAWFVLERTYVGRQIYAVGGNREAARLAGIPTRRRIFSMYVAASAISGLVGVLVIGRMNVADPSVGPGWELTAIAAAVVGGVSLTGGEGRILGVAAGAILLELIANGLLALHVSPYFQQVVQGAVLGIAILLDRVRARYFGRGRS